MKYSPELTTEPSTVRAARPLTGTAGEYAAAVNDTVKKKNQALYSINYIQ